MHSPPRVHIANTGYPKKSLVLTVRNVVLQALDVISFDFLLPFYGLQQISPFDLRPLTLTRYCPSTTRLSLTGHFFSDGFLWTLEIVEKLWQSQKNSRFQKLRATSFISLVLKSTFLSEFRWAPEHHLHRVCLSDSHYHMTGWTAVRMHVFPK